MTPESYLMGVGLPSYLSGGQPTDVYYSNPWDRMPDLLGGVDRECYKPNSVAWAWAQFLAPVPVAIAYALFGE